MKDRVYLRRSGPDYYDTRGEKITPRAFIHWCHADGCGEWGTFGFGVDSRKGKPGVWYCHKHRQLGEEWLAKAKGL